jgi:DNA repair photolyase
MDTVLFSSVTDAYQPLERKYQVTRNCLQLLKSHKVPVSVLTKSDLVLRDLDLLGEIPETEVGATIISLDEKVRQVFESGAPSAERRLAALTELASQGIRTYAFVGPIIPHLSTPTLDELIRKLAESGVAYIFLDKLNIKYGNRPAIEQALHTHFPEKAPAILTALRRSSTYYLELREELEEMVNRHGLETEFLF